MLRLYLGARRFQRGYRGINVGLADGLRRKLLLVALVGLFGKLGGRLQLLQLRIVVVRPEAQQHLAGRDFIAGIECDLLHDARSLCGQVRAAHRTQGSRGLVEGLPLGRGGHGGGDRLRG